MSSSTASAVAATTAMSRRTVRIGMFGGGTVGGGVYELLMDRLGGYSGGDMSDASTSTPAPPLPPTTTPTRPIPKCVVSKICVRDLDKPRDFTIHRDVTKLVVDVDEILNDDDVDIVVEVMGGTTLAKDVVMSSLQRGKSVVTANKALVAECLNEIQDAVVLPVTEHKKQGQVEGGSLKHFAYEAAVCGGIPIITTLQHCYVGDIIYQVMGICNGTTNYMLEKMESGLDYDDVLREAQDLGFAEADPSADVEGHDVRSKIAILAKLAFGTTIPVSSIPCVGITQITTVDFEYAKLLGCTIKLIGTAVRLSKYGEYDGPLSAYVSPMMVPTSHLLATSTTGAGNAVVITSANLGESCYVGPGAGRFPTANSVVSDVCRVASDVLVASSIFGGGGGGGGGEQNEVLAPSPPPFPLQTDMELDFDYKSSFYVRIAYRDGLGIVKRVGELCEICGISIHSLLQNPMDDPMNAHFVVRTECCRKSQVDALCSDIAKEEFVTEATAGGLYPLCMPLLLD